MEQAAVAAGLTTGTPAGQEHGRMALDDQSGPGHRAAAGPGGARGTVPLLFLISDTGGGHRSAAVAVQQALERACPGRFAITLCDPLGGPDAAPLLRWVTRLYGPVTRRAPWLWGAAYYLTNSRPAAALLSTTLLRLADRPTARAAAAQRPAAIVSFHPLTGRAAHRASRMHPASARHAPDDDREAAGNSGARLPRPAPAHRESAGHAGQARPGRRAGAAPGRPLPVVTVVTDLGAAHAAWRHGGADLTIVPPGQAGRGRARQAGRDRSPAGHGGRVVRAGPPAGREFWAGPAEPAERAALRQALGVSPDRLLIVLAGGGEGCGGIGRRAAALLRRFADVHVIAVCGRNIRLQRQLQRRAAQAGGRLTVTGYTRQLPDLLRCADLVVTKAGPGTIAEAACCGAPLLLTKQLPGQERGNAAFVISAGAGRRALGVRGLLAEAGRLHADRAALDGLRAASARLGRPGDTRDIARLIATLAGHGLPAAAGAAVLAGAGEHGQGHRMAPGAAPPGQVLTLVLPGAAGTGAGPGHDPAPVLADRAGGGPDRAAVLAGSGTGSSDG
jgi:1,2-diacylglycerol 3-beta-galactosyltransferase